jgi:cytochrome P450
MSRPYHYPPGLSHNLVFYFFSKFRPGDPITFFQHLADTYGDAAYYHIGPERVLFLNHPELIKDVLINRSASLHKERTQERMKILLGNGLITSEDPYHRKQRLVMQPAFHRQRIPEYGRHMVEKSLLWCDQWRDRMQRGDVHLDASAEMMALALSIVAKTLFDTEVSQAVRAINDEVNAVMKLYQFLVSLPRAEYYINLPIPGLTRFRKARKHLDTVVFSMIEEHRRDGDRGDLLSMLLGARYEDGLAMSDQQIRDEAMTIFLAGYETMANALTWTWYLLSQNPEAEGRLHEELDTVLGGRTPAFEDLPNLRYTEQVLAEAMRLYPPAWAMGRRTTEDLEVGPYYVQRGTNIYFSQYMIQRSERWWPDPLKFDPERFTPENKAGRLRFVYFPFGGGGRQCIGESFAWMEGVLVLATLAQHFELRTEAGFVPQLYPSVTLRPKCGMNMVLKSRKS